MHRCLARIIPALAAAPALAQQATFEVIQAPVGYADTYLRGISRDGHVAVGTAEAAGSPGGLGPARAFRWTHSGGIAMLTNPPGVPRAEALGTSGDGSLVVGTFGDGFSYRKPFLWSAAIGMTDLGYPPGQTGGDCLATCISDDGSIVGGVHYSPQGQTLPWIWTDAAGIQLLSDHGEVQEMSSSGGVLVGDLAAGGTSFRWTPGQGFTLLPPPGPLEVNVTGISDDGLVLVGTYDDQLHPPNYFSAFTWRAATGFRSLAGIPNATSTFAFKANADGSTIVGASGFAAAIWRPGFPCQPMFQALASMGVSTTSYSMYETDGVSADGMTIIGLANGPGGIRGWVAHIIPTCYANCDNSTTPPVLNVNDFQCFLNKFAAADPIANCDSSTTSPALNIFDFVCFLNRYAAGCS